jgi:hypothetical protein
MNAELQRLDENKQAGQPWRRWGPYVAERQWGTVREDYSADGDAWNYFPHDDARSRAYRWGEDGIAGFCDAHQRLCLALALWNGRDPILKERFFGLSNREGNHGEDCKELWWYLDATPTHSYLKMLYKYPQRAFPYDLLVAENGRRSREEPEFELTDTGIFDQDRYFDVFVEYAKAAPDDIEMRITVCNRGPEAAELHVLPHVWFRNTWSWVENTPRPTIRVKGPKTLECRRPAGAVYRVVFDGTPEFLFCDNDTDAPRLFGGAESGFFKNGINNFVVNGMREAVNPLRVGTKAAAHYSTMIGAGGTWTVRLRLSAAATTSSNSEKTRRSARDEIVELRRREADEYYADLQQDIADADARLVQRQAFAGMIWTKQFYHFDIPLWLKGDPAQPAPPPERVHGRNHDWEHLNNAEVISMPAKWEYPWYAAWDLAFHTIPFALIDPEFAKEQLILLAREWYMHPNGQFPAYEWNFSDVNPPVHAWAAWRVFQIDRRRHRHDRGDLAFLERVFHKLLLNFTWWVNRKDAQGRNIFHGGFLGLDNIGVFDRNSPSPDGSFLNQADATSWMAMYCLNLLRIALELALHNRAYEDIASKFFEHFLHIAEAMTKFSGGGRGLWDEADGFYYDGLSFEDGRDQLLKVRSIVGLIPLFAVETLEPEMLARFPDFTTRLQWFLDYRPDLANLVSRWHEPGRGDRRLLSLVRGHRMKRLLKRMLDETEFLSDFGVRSLSKYHLEHPFAFQCNQSIMSVRYTPGESDSSMFGGNSNWRGPIWFPINFLLIESLQKFHHYYGDDFLVECPTGSGHKLTIQQISKELTRRLTRLFMKDSADGRPIFGACEKMQSEHFRDRLLFHEYFHGDTGRGLGASHQTGWTGLIAKLLMPRRSDDAQPSDKLERSGENAARRPRTRTKRGS